MKGIKSKKKRIVNGQTLLVTVDLGKNSNVGSFRYPGGKDSNPFAFKNNYQGFQEFWKRITRAWQTSEAKKVVFAFESTGPYGEPLIHFLHHKPVELVQVNPMHTKRLKELQGNSPNKTDRKDPRVIADIVELGHGLSVIVPEGAAAELRRLTQARERYVQDRTALMNKLQQQVFLIFPELLSVMKDFKSKSIRFFLRHYPTPEEVAACGLKKITAILRRVSRCKLGRQRAEALYEAAAHSSGIREGLESIVFDLQGLLEMVEVFEQRIEQAEKRMEAYLKQVVGSRFILSIKGVGIVTAAGLFGEVADFSRFKNSSQIIKLSGLDLYEISSGIRQGQRRISKRGRPLLRKLLFFGAINTAREGGIFHDVYQRYRQRGMVKTKALVAIARKLLRLIFALLRDHREYISGFTHKSSEMLKAA